MKKTFRPLIIFYILVAYIFVQFCWWAYHIYDLQLAIHNLQLRQGVETNLSSKIWMIVGEGGVFLILLLLGAIITTKSFKKEIALGKQQKNFLLSITHELKSPIASVKLYLETLQKHTLEKEKQKEIISNSLNETERLLSLAENILLSAKIESGTFSLYKEKINLSEFTEETISKTVFFREKTHSFMFNVEPNIFLKTDKLAYSSLLLNLVENAVKYSPVNSKITIGLKKENTNVIVSVSDEGIGIAEKEKKNIFKKFYRIGNEETRKTKGTGLGLYIVKYLVGQLDGILSVKNNSPKGSIFEVKMT